VSGDLYYCASRNLEISYDSEVPKEIRDAAHPLILDAMWLLPTWLHLLRVRFTEPTNSGDSMSTTANEEYRSGTLYIHPSWLMHTDDRWRAADMRHEFIHFAIEGVYNAAQAAIKMLASDQVQALCVERLRIALERAVVDLEQSIKTKIYT
jgi:hypothetical protein